MKYSLTSRIAGAALAAFAAQTTQAQEMKTHAGLLFNGLESHEQYFAGHALPALEAGQDPEKFAAQFFLSLDGKMNRMAITCEFLRQNTVEDVAAPFLRDMEASGERNEMSEGISLGAIRGAKAACTP